MQFPEGQRRFFEALFRETSQLLVEETRWRARGRGQSSQHTVGVCKPSDSERKVLTRPEHIDDNDGEVRKRVESSREDRLDRLAEPAQDLTPARAM
jgi:hypothetical protein